MLRLILRLLGPPRLEREGVPLEFQYRKNVALLAYLAVTGERHSRETLLTMLWPELEPSRARAGLRRDLSVLRATLGDAYLLADRETVGLDLEAGLWLDVDQFHRLSSSWRGHGHAEAEACPQCLADLAEAVELYRGDFMAGFSLRDSLAFDEWQLYQTEDLRQELAVVLERLVRGCSAQGRHEAAIPYARRWMALDPLHEPTHRYLMQLYAQSGQRAAALRQYEECARILDEELGLSPSGETTSLCKRIRDGTMQEPPAALPQEPHLRPEAGAPRHNLPAQVTSFVGRERELAELGRLLADPQVRLATVVGAGGMGKTRLALQTARAALGQYPGGVWLVELAPVPDGASVPRAVAAVLGVQEQPSQPLPETIAGALQGRELLLLLDNCEHVLDGVAPLAALLLARCPELALLATSREPLRIAGEHLYDLPPMALPKTGDEAKLLAADAVQLFRQRATAVRPGFALARDNVAAVADLCRRVDGMPLAIELAAARLRALSLPELARHLDDRFRLLTGGSRAALPRQQTLRSTVAWSYDLLGAGERLLFDRLSVFAGSFSLQGAEEVCSGEGLAREEVLDLLAGLVDQSLVGRVEGPEGAGRYRLLETLRTYGQERLGERGETEEVAARHAWYYVSLAEAEEPILWKQERETIAARRRLNAEDENLAAAMRWALARGKAEVALRIGGALYFWTLARANNEQYAAWLRAALAQGEGVAPLYQAKALFVISVYKGNWGRGDWTSDAQRALELASTAGDPLWIGRVLGTVAHAAGSTGDTARARAYHEQSLELARRCDDRMWIVSEAAFLALCEPPRRNKALLEELLPQAPYCLRVWLHRLLGHVNWALGDLDGARAHFQASIANARAQEFLHQEGEAWIPLGVISSQCGDHAGAERMLERGGALLRQVGNYSFVLLAVSELGRLAWRQGKMEKASSRFQEALDMARQHGYLAQGALARLGLALVAVEQGEHGQAEALCAQPGPDLPEWDDEAQALALCTGGRVAFSCGQGTRAVEWYRQALVRVRRTESRPDTVEVLEFLAWALAADGGAAEAVCLLALTEREREEMGIVLPPVDRPHRERALEGARVALGEEEFAVAWAEERARDLWATAEELLDEL